MQLFRLDWRKIDVGGGGCEYYLADNALQCVRSFYDYWGTTDINRQVTSIIMMEVDNEVLNQISTKEIKILK